MIRPLLMATGLLAAAPAFAQAGGVPARDPTRTEVWTPVPATVATPVGRAPSDAIVLFDGKDLSAWESEQGGRVPWRVDDGALTVVPGSKGIRTRQRFCDIQLHVEWRSPSATAGFDGQNRGNSGIFLQELYELQVLDSHHNPTYANGQAGSIYKQAMPLVNASCAGGVAGLRHHLEGAALLAGRWADLTCAHHRAAQRRAGAGRYRAGGQDRVHRRPFVRAA